MTKVYYNPEQFDEEKIRANILKELKSGELLTSFLLAHSLIESYLLEIFIYSSMTYPKFRKLNKKVFSNLERIGFSNLIHINLILGNVPFTLYKEIVDFNRKRNIFVHELISLDLNDRRTQDKIKKSVKRGLEICQNLSVKYKKILDTTGSSFSNR